MAEPRGSLKAVLTCASPVLAQRVAVVLTAVGLDGGGAALDAEAQQILAELSAAPAASFREALEHVRSATWPAVDAGRLSWQDLGRGNGDADAVPAGLDEQARTPGGARLAQLAGKVVRFIQLREYHVHDEKRLIAAATAIGWTPPDDEEETAQADDEVVDALMLLADREEAVPGADVVCLLPHHDRDYDWDMCSEMFFQDHDVLMLYDETLDGIETPDNPTNAYLRMGDLRPASWFEHFANVEPRDSNRGFRR